MKGMKVKHQFSKREIQHYVRLYSHLRAQGYNGRNMRTVLREQGVRFDVAGNVIEVKES